MTPAVIDHLVYACPNLEEAVDDIAARTGVRAAGGGQHPGLGTRNALLSLGARCYLELLGPDPAQPPPAEPRPFGLDSLRGPALRGWAAAPASMDSAIQAARAAGTDLGQPIAGLRYGPDGTPVSWQMTPPSELDGMAIAPFLIDWENSLHPAAQAPPGLLLADFVIRVPDPDRIIPLLDALGLTVRIQHAQAPGFRAALHGPAGQELVLTS
jgi:glyoxalase-like protein